MTERGDAEPELLDSEGDLARPAPMTAMRGTNFVAGLRWLRERGLDARYLDALTPEMRAAVVAAGATDWVPMHVVLAHYVAFDSLGLTAEQRYDLGASASRSINGVVLTTIARLAGRTGLSPLVPLARAAKIFARNYQGGAVGVFRTGTSEARFDVRGTPLASSACHRDSLVGALVDGARPFATDPKVHEIANERTRTSYVIRIRW